MRLLAYFQGLLCQRRHTNRTILELKWKLKDVRFVWKCQCSYADRDGLNLNALVILVEHVLIGWIQLLRQNFIIEIKI